MVQFSGDIHLAAMNQVLGSGPIMQIINILSHQ